MSPSIGNYQRDAGCAVAGVSSCLECQLETCIYDELDNGHARFVTSLSDRIGGQALSLRDEGKKYTEIAAELKVSCRTLYRIAKNRQRYTASMK